MSQLANTFPEILASRDIVQGKNPYPTLELSIRNPENRLLDPLVEKTAFRVVGRRWCMRAFTIAIAQSPQNKRWRVPSVC